RAAAQIDLGVRRKARLLKLRQLAAQNFENGLVLVANVDENFFSLDRPGCDEHSFEELVGAHLEVMAVLESAGLALITIDRHKPRPLFSADQRPFAARREASAAEATQA